MPKMSTYLRQPKHLFRRFFFIIFFLLLLLNRSAIMQSLFTDYIYFNLIIMALPDYKLRYNRAASFNFAPNILQSKVSSLIEAGFYYTQHKDMVQCYNCKITLSNWRRSSRPFAIHRRKSPRCSVAQKNH